MKSTFPFVIAACSLVAGAAPAEALTHQSIEALEVGDRVITAATLRDGADETFDTAVTTNWQVIDLEVAGAGPSEIRATPNHPADAVPSEIRATSNHPFWSLEQRD